MLTRRISLPFLLIVLLAAPVTAHQGAHPTGLDPCPDAILAVDSFQLGGEGVVGSLHQPILEPQQYQLVNIGAPGELPRSIVKIGFALGSGHQTGYGDYTVRIVRPSGAREFNASDFPGTWLINPLLEGWSGSMVVHITNETCDFAMQATATWNLPQPDWIRNPCEPCRNLTCRSGAAIGSVELSIPAGVVQYGLEPVSLLYESEQLANEGAARLEVSGPGANGPVIMKTGNVVTSVECGAHLARLTTEASPADPNRFVVRVSSDKSDPDNTVYRESIVENVTLAGGATALRFTETVAGKTTVRDYTQPDQNTWILDEEALRRTTSTVLSETATTRITRWQVEEMNASNAWSTVALREDHETKYDWGWTLTRRIVDPDGEALTSEWDYYQDHEFSGPNADTSGRGRLKRASLPTGLVRTFEYLDSDPFDPGFTQVEIVREAFAGNALALERRRHLSSSDSDLSELDETWIAGTLVEKTEITAHSAGGSNWRNELHHPAAGGPPLLTRFEYDQWTNNPLLQKAIFPDGTIEQVEATVSGGLKTVTIYRGVDNPGPGFPILTDQEVRTVLNQVGQVVQSEICEIRSGAVYPVQMRVVTQLDSLDRPTTTEVFHSGDVIPTFTETTQFGCCGIESVEGQDRLPATYFYDDLARPRKVHRNGISTETIYDGLTVRTHVYPETAPPTPLSLATPQTEASIATRNLAGHIVAEATRAPHDGSLVTTTYATTYNPGAGTGRRVVQTLPLTPDDLGVAPTITEEFYLDGRLKQRTGAPVADRLITYGVNPTGLAVTSALLDSGSVARQAVTTQLDWMGRALKVTYPGDADGDGNPDEEIYEYDAAGRLAKQVDPDGVAHLFDYDLANEVARRAIDLNGNGIIDPNTDELRFSRNGIGIHAGGDVITWSEIVARDVDAMGAGVDRILSRRETSADLLQSWTHTYHDGATESTHAVTSYLPALAGAWDVTTVNPDSTALLQEFRGGLLDRESLRAADATTLLTRTYLYDSHQRLQELQDTSAPTILRAYSAALVDAPASVTIGNRITHYEYDARGRQTLIDEPDTLDHNGLPVDNRQLVSYVPHNAVREISGTPSYRRSYTYAQRLETLTTYGTTQTVTRWEYDPDRGWPTGKRYDSPSPGTGAGESFSFSPGGRLVQRLSARSITTDYARGADGRITSLAYSDGTPSVVIDQRDRLGRVQRITDATGQRLLTYTDQDSLASTTYQPGSLLAGWSVSPRRDSHERLVSLDLQHGGATPYRLDYSYDSAGRLATAASHGLVAHYQYDPARQLVSQVAIVDDKRYLHFASRQYDALNRLERITYHNGNLQGAFAAHSDYRYQRDAFGRITHATLRDGTQWRYLYTSAGELASARRHLTATSPALLEGNVFAWSYDGVGNRTSSDRGGNSTGANLRTTTYNSNPLNQLTSVQAPGFADVTGTAPASPATSSCRPPPPPLRTTSTATSPPMASTNIPGTPRTASPASSPSPPPSAPASPTSASNSPTTPTPGGSCASSSISPPPPRR